MFYQTYTKFPHVVLINTGEVSCPVQEVDVAIFSDLFDHST